MPQQNLNPKDISFFSLISEDLRVHRNDPISQGFVAIFVHRLANLIKGVRFSVVRKVLWVFYLIINRFVEYGTGITILHYTKVGRRVHIWHHSGIVLNGAEIGNDVIVRQNTTIGELVGVEGRPVIEDGVDIGCGAVMLGPIRIGKSSVIGANAVVLIDVPEGCVAAGVPAKILRRVGANGI